jgi:Uma2 family endonuclease
MGALRIEDLPYYTYEDYKIWDDKWELIYGVAYAMAPMPMIKHQRVSNKIAWQLEDIFSGCKRCQALMPIDWKISEDTIVQPDNSVICHIPLNEAYITKAPAIIFEILSPSTAKKDQTIKFDLYEKEGVKYYIIVDPNDSFAKVFKLQDGRYIKVCDATDEKVNFEIDECDNKALEFDFSKIWDKNI